MAKTKKQAKKAKKSATPYVQRLVRSEEVHDHLADAARGIRSASRRIQRLGAKAPEDKQLYARLRETATALSKALTALQGQPTEPPKRRAPKAIALAAGAGGAAVMVRKRRGKAAAAPAQPS